MTKKKERSRIIYETCLGQSVRAYQWQELKKQMIEAQMPVTYDNLNFVAKCKKVAPRKGIQAHVLKFMVQAALDLNGKIEGATLKNYIYSHYPEFSRDKFYRAFRSMDMSFKNDKTYFISDLGEVFYRLFA